MIVKVEQFNGDCAHQMVKIQSEDRSIDIEKEMTEYIKFRLRIYSQPKYYTGEKNAKGYFHGGWYQTINGENFVLGVDAPWQEW